MLTDTRGAFYLRERETDHRCQSRPGRVFSTIML
jgi:hypothetical protein